MLKHFAVFDARRNPAWTNALAVKRKIPLSDFMEIEALPERRCILVCTQAKTIDEEEVSREIKVFKAAADATRLRILKLLNDELNFSQTIQTHPAYLLLSRKAIV